MSHAITISYRIYLINSGPRLSQHPPHGRLPYPQDLRRFREGQFACLDAPADPRPLPHDLGAVRHPGPADVPTLLLRALHPSPHTLAQDPALKLGVGDSDVVEGLAERARGVQPRLLAVPQAHSPAAQALKRVRGVEHAPERPIDPHQTSKRSILRLLARSRRSVADARSTNSTTAIHPWAAQNCRRGRS